MSLYHHLKTWLGKKRDHPHEEETVALPEIHTTSYGCGWHSGGG